MITTKRPFAILGLMLTALMCFPRWGWSQEAPPRPATPTDAVEVQTRGPVHEAYAQPLNQTPRPGPVVPKQPPQPVAELPPDQKPEGDNVQWVPGYWAWDNDRNDFLWVSGFWRVVPPARKWVAGHWAQVEGGWQWVAGLWAPSGQTDLPYQSPPPPSLDNGPTVPAPNDDSMYVPGCWMLRDTRYAWRPGFWTAAQPGYVWCPAHYCDTPSGSIFVNGYWDYPLAERGLLFAPVCFNSPVWQSPGYCYQPNYCVDVAGLLGSLFVRPDYCHYYFGDYYGRRYAALGFRPWHAYGASHYDPLFAHAHWEHRHDPGWFRGLHSTYLGRLNGELPRPAHTLAQQHALLHDPHFHNAGNLRTVAPLNQFHGENLRRTAAVDRNHVVEPHQAVERPGDFHGVRSPALALPQPHVAAGHPGVGGPAVVSHQHSMPGPEFRAAPAVSGPQGFAGAPHPAPVYHPQPPVHAAPAYHPPAFHSQGHAPPAFHGGGHAPPAFHGGGHGGGGHGGGGHGGHRR
jgi:hypothetical protein